MLRVGLTGDLGSGKSTVAKMFADRGAIVLSSDEMARAMMQPGQPLYTDIIRHFGPTVVNADHTLNRRELAWLAFDPAHPRVEELNALVHPAVIAEQAELSATIAEANPEAILVVESALIFSTTYAPGNHPWQSRFDRIVLVTAPTGQKIARFVERTSGGRNLTGEERRALEADARQRLALQHSEDHVSECLVLHNEGDLAELERQVDAAWKDLQHKQKTRDNPRSF